MGNQVLNNMCYIWDASCSKVKFWNLKFVAICEAIFLWLPSFLGVMRVFKNTKCLLDCPMKANFL